MRSTQARNSRAEVFGELTAFMDEIVRYFIHRPKFDPGTPYAIRPHNTSETYLWTVKDGVTVRASK